MYIKKNKLTCLGIKYLGALIGLLLFMTHYTSSAQVIDILIKNGHVIDAKNGIDSRMDVAISGGKI